MLSTVRLETDSQGYFCAGNMGAGKAAASLPAMLAFLLLAMRRRKTA
jgi:hypothetical protein